MMKYSLDFQSPHDIIDFVKIVNNFEYDVDVVSGKKIVDAKSVVGVMALSKAGMVDVVVHTEDCGEFLDKIRPYLKQEKSA